MPDGPLTSAEDPNGGLISSGETRSGSIVTSDMDGFQFEGDVNDRVLISVEETSGEPGFFPRIKLYPPEGGDLEAGASGLIDHQLQQSGLYTIVVHDNDYSEEGTYNISLECP